MVKETDELRVLSLTNYIKELPGPTHTVIYTLIMTAIVGALGYALTGERLANIATYGTLMGILLIGAPAVLSSFFTTWLSAATKKKIKLRRSSYLSFFSVLILSVVYLIGSVLVSIGEWNILFELMVFGYVLVFATRIFVLTVTYPYNIPQNILISAIHPVLGFLFLYMPNVALSTIPITTLPPSILIMKALGSFAIIMFGVIMFFVLINAPMKRNFGINTTRLTESFLSHWLDKSGDIEELLKRLSEKADTLVGVIVFKGKRKLKSIIITPYLHQGPFGDVGGSKLTKVFTEEIEKRRKATVFITHGTVTHDLNPLDAKELYSVAENIAEEIKNVEFSNTASRFVRHKLGSAQVSGQRFGDSVFLTSTFSPHSTEDIDFSIGLAVMNKLSRDFDSVIYADCHNSWTPAHRTILSGDPWMFALLNSMDGLSKKLVKSEVSRFKQGIAVDPMDEYGPGQGIGSGGLRVSVFDVNGYRNAYVIFDANNMVTELRQSIIEAVKGLGIDDVEVMTTDTHYVNNIQGVENPIGWAINQKELVKRAVKTTKAALKDLEEVSVGTRMIRVNGIHVLGAQKATELMSTINSIVSIMKILGPMIFGSTLFLSLLAVLLI